MSASKIAGAMLTAGGILMLVMSSASAAGETAMPGAGEREIAVARAIAAMDSLQAGLLHRLRAELERGGPQAAVAVCRDSAAVITARIARAEGLELGRTSHRLRNPANAPRDWARSTVAGAAGKKAAAESLHVFDLGERLGVLRPIGIASPCMNCHGSPEMVQRAIGPALAATYPEDAAVGFAPGDLRGFMWAEVPPASPRAAPGESEPRR